MGEWAVFNQTEDKEQEVQEGKKKLHKYFLEKGRCFEWNYVASVVLQYPSVSFDGTLKFLAAIRLLWFLGGGARFNTGQSRNYYQNLKR